MIVLAVSIGVIFLCLVALPVLFVFYRNNVSSKMLDKNGQVIPGSDGGNADGKSDQDGSGNKVDGSKSPSKYDQHQIITIDTGLNVDHALHFVEYTDHIHDLVFESEDNDQYPTNMWIKQISTDTQSIDISNQDPIKMTYTNSLYTKNSHNPNNSTSSSHGAPGSQNG